ncbi:P2X purinoceptor 1 isoform X2 [Anguilla anguilla]|uniref:P2X purinoceptor 1 isoform X2 n=1 Tax=Anguilla anguilla TaxID=7936 RepID=UPI0015B0FB97|nr:P2X purinoceptor 1 isoform X2 [Anguilla anguilla]
MSAGDRKRKLSARQTQETSGDCKMKSILTDALSDFLFEYETPRQVLVKSKRVGIVCRVIQLVVLAYIIGWVFIYEKGYQITDTAISSVFTKVKGVGYTQVDGKEQVWDMSDYVFPEQGDGSFVVMTNYIVTLGQKQDKCPELQGKFTCKSDEDCKEGEYKRLMTGKCVQETETCEVFSWCPVEDDTKIPAPPRLMAAENFTLFIKNSITFPEFEVVRSNLVEGVDKNYINTCIYNQTSDPLCPIFRLGDIVTMSGFSFAQIAPEGGAVGILVDWTCDLDWDVKHCKPVYSFHGLYATGKGPEDMQASMGYNFRKAKYYMDGNVEKRTLTKVFGIRIDILVRGLARKFDIIPTLTAIGSGVGIFGVATVVCDLVLLYILPKRDFYKNMKFKNTTIQEQAPVITDKESDEVATFPIVVR